MLRNICSKLNKLTERNVLFRESRYSSKAVNHTMVRSRLFCTQNEKLPLLRDPINNLKFSDLESEKILKIINQADSDELSGYDISKGRAQKVKAYRKKHGQFSSIEDILDVDTFGIKILHKLCVSIINEKHQVKAKPKVLRPVKQFSQLTSPTLTEVIREQVRSCCSIHVGFSSVTWTRFQITAERPCTVTDWKHFSIDDRKLHIAELLPIMMNVIELIPNAHIYVFESPRTAQGSAPGTPAQVNINVQQSQMIAMISLAMAYRNSTDHLPLFPDAIQQQVFYLKKFLWSRLYSTLVGSERVSTSTKINKLLKGNTDSENFGVQSQIDVNNTLRKYFESAESYQKEYLGQSMLLGMSFVRLCLLKCPKSLEIISHKN